MSDPNTGRKLRYSERRRLDETGSLGDLEHDSVPQAVRMALFHLMFRSQIRHQAPFSQHVLNRIAVHFSDFTADWDAATPLISTDRSVDEILDYCEIAVEAGMDTTKARATGGHYYDVATYGDLESKINPLFETHRFGYRMVSGQAQRLDSPLLHVEVVGPALLAARRAGWSEVEERYASAILNHRGGETAKALTDANAAIESALKAVGMRGNATGDLTKALAKSPLLAPYGAKANGQLKGLVDNLMVWRSNFGDAHGGGPGVQDAPPELAGLAIHWSGAFIVFLAALASGD
jgi:hypothetical protein